MQTSLVLDALTMAVWRRKPKAPVIIHSDQGSQFGSDAFARWCQDNRLSPSMSRRGNCWDNAVAESFFSSLKIELVKKRIFTTRDQARSEIFDYIEGFYNRIRRHKHLKQLSPYEFERRQTALRKRLRIWGNATASTVGSMKKRFTENQIVGILKEAEAGMKVTDVILKHGISDAAYYTI